MVLLIFFLPLTKVELRIHKSQACFKSLTPAGEIDYDHDEKDQFDQNHDLVKIK